MVARLKTSPTPAEAMPRTPPNASSAQLLSAVSAPSDKSPDRKQLRKLADVIHNGLSEAGDGTERNVDRLRPVLREDLTRLFRQFSGTALAAFAHLGLIALDVERLRAGLVLRLVLPQSEERPSWA